MWQYGLEWEVEWHTTPPTALLQQLQHLGWQLHWDASLRNGIELVSHPAPHSWWDTEGLSWMRATRTLLQAWVCPRNGETSAIQWHVAPQYGGGWLTSLGRRTILYLLLQEAVQWDESSAYLQWCHPRRQRFTQRLRWNPQWESLLQPGVWTPEHCEERLLPLLPPHRYYSLNLHALVRHGTIEYRRWNSTLEEATWRTIQQQVMATVEQAAHQIIKGGFCDIAEQRYSLYSAFDAPITPSVSDVPSRGPYLNRSGRRDVYAL